MNRTELLAQWAELAPGECRANTTGDMFMLTSRPGLLIEGGTNEARDSLLGALIEAIRARGWHYNLFSDETERDNECPTAWHTASIYRTAENVVPKTIAQKAEPCDALLAAYVTALTASATAALSAGKE